ncbi:hypothetical protein IRZ71_08335 [Flavobacterium sp. ANB]|uniref:hypothetical protein n=1 Tax=unclassified Flavobacterium TaxID=196869 RepID=UPI0012B6E643|nr:MULTISPECIES: hypothetical protein [unclassified Flavobacterium]MBF4516347.1 hypothetical protein [Flavobacterium sp. ANB]MTD69756.1 hypothetical protein [Flavobacterium sp. LC2016-13]
MHCVPSVETVGYVLFRLCNESYAKIATMRCVPAVETAGYVLFRLCDDLYAKKYPVSLIVKQDIFI